MRQQIYILLILTIGVVSCQYQDMDSLVSSIAEKNRVECESIGFAGSSSTLYKKFEKLKRKATKEELLELTNHNSLAIVGYSSYALIDRKLIEPNKLFQRFIDNEENVSTFCGCIMSRETLSSLIYHRYWNSRIEFSDDGDYEKKTLNDSENLQKMDSLILYSDKPDWILLIRAFENRVYSDDYKVKIEEWAFDKIDFYALKYIFKNLRNGNEERLIESFNKYIENEENHSAQKEKINLMKKEIKLNIADY